MGWWDRYADVRCFYMFSYVLYIISWFGNDRLQNQRGVHQPAAVGSQAGDCQLGELLSSHGITSCVSVVKPQKEPILQFARHHLKWESIWIYCSSYMNMFFFLFAIPTTAALGESTARLDSGQCGAMVSPVIFVSPRRKTRFGGLESKDVMAVDRMGWFVEI